MLFTSEGILNIRNEKWKDVFTEIDPEGSSFVDHTYTRAYLRHLTISKEMLAAQIATLHNLGFYMKLVAEARERITAGTFAGWKDEMVIKLQRRL